MEREEGEGRGGGGEVLSSILVTQLEDPREQWSEHMAPS